MSLGSHATETSFSAERSRVLVVSPAASLALLIEQAMDLSSAAGMIERVDGVNDAIHRISNKPSPNLLIVKYNGPDSMDQLKELRALAPQAHVWLLVSESQSASIDPHPMEIDRILTEPLSPQILGPMLASALNGQIAPSEASPSASEESTEDIMLGDVDLLEQILIEPAKLRDLALELIGQQWQVKDLGWVDQEIEIPAGHLGSVIELAGQSLGFLHASGDTDCDTLESWAGWIARWLAVGQRLVRLEDMAMHDELTGAWNRRYFNQFFKMVLDCAAAQRFRVTLLLFDLDDFKSYNDRFGHIAGDQILCETVRLIQSLVREHDVVARVGGDEFAVIFWDAQQRRQPDSEHPDDVLVIARRFQEAIDQHAFPKLGAQAEGHLTISGGLSSFPWDGHTAGELIDKADHRLMKSKKQGKNVMTFGPVSTKSDSTEDQSS